MHNVKLVRVAGPIDRLQRNGLLCFSLLPMIILLVAGCSAGSQISEFFIFVAGVMETLSSSPVRLLASCVRTGLEINEHQILLQ